MSIDSNIPEVENVVGQLEQYYRQELPQRFKALAKSVLDDLKSGKFKNRTGDLRRSMRTFAVDDGVVVAMLNYGYYLSFGVDGKNRRQALGLPAGVASAFSENEGYKFGQTSGKVWGIAPRNFYPADLEEEIINLLLTEE